MATDWTIAPIILRLGLSVTDDDLDHLIDEWKEFYKRVRVNGWRAKGKPAWGFGDKQIKRIVYDLRDK